MPDASEGSTSIEDAEEILKFMNPEALLADTYELAFIGHVEIPGKPVIALYDRTACLRILAERDGMGVAGAKDYFEHNAMGSEQENAPGFATILRTAHGSMLDDKAVEDFIRKLREQAIKDPESATAVIQLLVTAIGDDKDEPLEEMAQTVLEILEPKRLGGLKWLLCQTCGTDLKSEGEKTNGYCDNCNVQKETDKRRKDDE